MRSFFSGTVRKAYSWRPLSDADLESDRSRNAVSDYELLAVEVPEASKLAAHHHACPSSTCPIPSAPRKLAVARRWLAK
jgi:hypothetical protein